jgi:hypothetical protein
MVGQLGEHLAVSTHPLIELILPTILLLRYQQLNFDKAEDTNIPTLVTIAMLGLPAGILALRQ